MRSTFIGKCARLALVAVLLVTGATASRAQEQTDEDAVMRNILTRTSIRKFKQQPVEDAKIERLLRAGMAAPTSGDLRPWHFVVLKDKESIARYAAGNKRHAEDIMKTPLFIIVCGDTTRMAEGQGRDLWVQDLSAVSENILLAAHAMGLGACWTTVYPIERKVSGVRRTLRLSDRFIPLCAIIIGYPDESPAPKDKWDEGNVTYGIPE